MIETDADLNSPSSILSALSEHQKQILTELLDRYLCGLEHGEQLDPEELKREHPDLAGVLTAYLQKLDALHCIAAGFQGGDRVEPGNFDLGDYAIQREIGRGGMGIVYEARQKSLNRRVALKLLPMAAMLDARQIARFKNESQAAGQLKHSNIVPVYSFGIERGIHFYAMQLIDGQPIDHWVAQHRQAGSATDWRFAVRLAINVADALQCAHETGVVHRDIKPSNLLLEDDQRVWITDFGLARCQNDASLTLSGDLVGTLRYMSPEQANSQSELVDHRTDIYSLAATLFEMLTLQPAVQGNDGPAMLRAIDQDDPPKLRKLRSDVPTDLEVVLQKAMARKKDVRYATAGQFADDLRAVLCGRPTVARPPSLAALAGRYAVRHRKMVITGSAVLTAAMAWLLISSLIMLKKDHDARISEIDKQRYFQQARATVDDLGSRVAEQLASVPGAEQVRRSLLSEMLRYYEDFVAQATNDAGLKSELAVTYTQIGSLTQELNSSAEALPHYQQAEDIFSKLARESDLPLDTRRHRAQNSNQLGLALADLGRFDEAVSAYRRAIATQQKLLPESPDDTEIETELALMINNLALVVREMGRTGEASKLFDDAISRLSKIVEKDSSNRLAPRGLAAALGNLSSLSTDAAPENSIRLLEQAIDVQLASAEYQSNKLVASSEVAKTYNNLGAAYSRAREFAKANKAYRNAIRLQRQLHAIAPLVDTHRCDLAISLNNLAMLQQKHAQHLDAEASLRAAIRLQQ